MRAQQYCGKGSKSTITGSRCLSFGNCASVNPLGLSSRSLVSCGRIYTFRRRYGALNISFIYEVTPDTPFYPQGYMCADTPYEQPTGVHSFPFIYAYPEVKRSALSTSLVHRYIFASLHILFYPFSDFHPSPIKQPKDHLPNIISIIQGSRAKLSDYRAGPVHFFDRKIGYTYYLLRVDSHVYMLVIYLDRHVNRDTTTIEFMDAVAGGLRGTEVFKDMRIE